MRIRHNRQESQLIGNLCGRGKANAREAREKNKIKIGNIQQSSSSIFVCSWRQQPRGEDPYRTTSIASHSTLVVVNFNLLDRATC